jgi:hypothetical protein
MLNKAVAQSFSIFEIFDVTVVNVTKIILEYMYVSFLL